MRGWRRCSRVRVARSNPGNLSSSRFVPRVEPARARALERSSSKPSACCPRTRRPIACSREPSSPGRVHKRPFECSSKGVGACLADSLVAGCAEPQSCSCEMPGRSIPGIRRRCLPCAACSRGTISRPRRSSCSITSNSVFPTKTSAPFGPSSGESNLACAIPGDGCGRYSGIAGLARRGSILRRHRVHDDAHAAANGLSPEVVRAVVEQLAAGGDDGGLRRDRDGASDRDTGTPGFDRTRLRGFGNDPRGR